MRYFTLNSSRFLYNKKALLLFFLQAVLIFNVKAQLTTTRKGNYASMTYLVNNVLLGSGIKATNITYSGLDTAFGFFNGIKSNVGMDTGVILTNGGIGLAEGPSCKNNDHSDQACTTVFYNTTDGWPNASSYEDQDLAALISTTASNTYSCFILQFDFIAPSDSVQFQYVFGSNEEPCFYNNTYYDDFGFFLSGPGISGTFSNNAINLATIPGSNTSVSIKNVNCSSNSAYYVCNSPPATSGTNCAITSSCPNCPTSSAQTTVGYGGFTKVLYAKAKVQCGQKYHIKLGIANIGNGKYDSGVFLKGGSFKPTTSVAVSSSTNTTCSDSPVTLTATGGTSYTWSPAGSLNSTTGAVVTATPTTATTYTVIGTVATGCVDTSKISVNVNPNPTMSVTPSAPAVCSGGSVNLTASGASTYSWTPAAGLSCTTCANPIATPSATTKYYVTGTNASGCKSKDSVTVNVAAPVSVTVTPSIATICSGDSAQLNAGGATSYTWSPSTGLSCTTCSSTYAKPTSTVTYTVTGTTGSCNGSALVVVKVNPTPTLSLKPSLTTICSGNSAILTASGANTYVWTPTYAISSTSGSVVTVTPTVATTYIVKGSNESGCSAKDSVKIAVNPTPKVTLGTSPSSTICSGTSTILTAGGANTYAWSPASAISATTGSTVSVSPTVATTYTVTGTNGSGCTAKDSVKISVNPTPTVSIKSSLTTICSGNSATLTASGANTYVWSPAYAISSTTGTSVTVTPTVTTTYTVTGTNGSGCSDRDSVVISVNPTPSVSLSLSQSSTICSGTTSTITASGANTYVWSPAYAINSTTGSIVTVSPTVATTYVVTGTNGSGCSAKDSVKISVNPTPTVTLAVSPSPNICSGSSTTIKASGAATYVWSPSASLSSATASTVVASPIVTTTYTVIGTSTLGCNDTLTSIVNVTPTPTLSISPNSPGICPGDSVHILVTGAATYAWSPATGLSSTTGSSLIAKPATSTTYYVTGANGVCTSKDSVLIHVGNLSVTTTATSPTICSGNSTSITASGALTYRWSPSAGLNATTGSAVIASPTVTTIYSIVGTSGQGCSDSTKDTIHVNPLPVLSLSANNSQLVCYGAGGTTITASGAATYAWTPAGSLSCSTCTSPNANPNATTIYTVTGTSAAGCSSSDTISIHVDKLSVSANATSGTICHGDTTSVSASGGTTFIWSPAASLTCATCASSKANPAATTTYSVIITDAKGCKDSTTATVNVNPLPVVTVTANASSVCSGSADTLSASGASNYTWSPAAGLTCATCATTVATPTLTTTYTIIGTSNKGCNDTAKMVIAVNTMPKISVSLSGSGSSTVCTGQPVTLSANGGSNTVTYLWSNGSTASAITVVPTSDTVFSLVAKNGPCADTLAKIPVNIYPQLNVTVNSDTACIRRNAIVTANATGGDPGYTYSWSTGATGSSITIVPLANTTTVSCTVKDACGSTETTNTTVTAYTSPIPSFTANPPSILAGQYIKFIDSTTDATNYYWSFGNGSTSTDFDPYVQYTVAGDYTVTLIASNAGCRDTVSDTVHVAEEIIIPNVFTPNGDGQNDVFHVTMSSMKEYHIEIFNRWGQRVFESDSQQIDWAGRSEAGVEESDGIYFYIITATDYNGKAYKLQGNIQLIR